jgi:hypothetical protein
MPSLHNALRASLYSAAVLMALPAMAETLRFKANLTPLTGSSSGASGTLEAEYDTDTKKLTWNGSYQGVATYATSASFYANDPRTLIRIRSFDSPFQGSAILSDSQASGLRAGAWSIVIRTSGFPRGELVGKLEPAG